MPAWYARHFLTQAAVDEQVVRVARSVVGEERFFEKSGGSFKEFAHHLVGRGALTDEIESGMILAKLQDQLAFTDTATPVDRPEGAA